MAFSCKSRSGLCASCAARRLLDIGTHRCGPVIADVPIRQWVLTVPPPLRYLLAYNVGLLREVMGVFVRAVFAQLRVRTRRELELAKDARIEAGAVCVPQRFNSAIGLAPHLHALVTDGVWVQETADTAPTFRALPAPSKAEIAAVAWASCEGTTKALRQRGLWLDADPGDDRFALDEPFLASIAQASIAGLLCLGPSAGQRPMRLFGRAARSDAERADKGAKNGYGFDVHAGVRAGAKDKQARERLCRYWLRPPLSNDRLRRTSDGRYEITLKRPWDDGTTALVVSGEELLARLSALVPLPRVHTIRYVGVWAPRSAWRQFVLPEPESTSNDAPVAGHGATSSCARQHRYRLSWAPALAKVYAIDVTGCPRCGQKGMQQMAVITDAQVLRARVAAIERKREPP